MDLSIIVPGRNEYPQSIFTIGALVNDLRQSGLEYEIIYVDNCSLRRQHLNNNQVRIELDQIIDRFRDRDVRSCMADIGNAVETWIHALEILDDVGDSTGRFLGMSDDGKPSSVIKSGEVRYLIYDDTESHWQAKNLAIRVAKADTILSIDAHVLTRPGLVAEMYRYFKDNNITGSLHLPNQGLLSPADRHSVYRMRHNKDYGELSYTYIPSREKDKVYRVPCMTTLGAMFRKELLTDTLGWFPTALGIYQGGEHFYNYSLGIMGYGIYIYPFGALQHFAGKSVKRAYSFNYFNQHLNRTIANVIVCKDLAWAKNYVEKHPDTRGMSDENKDRMYQEATSEIVLAHRNHIQDRAKMTIEEFIERTEQELPDYVTKREFN